MGITQDEIIEGIKTLTAAAIPLAIAIGVSGGDVQSLGDTAEAFVVAGGALIVAARRVAADIRSR